MNFNKETDLEETSIGKIPKEWKVTSLKAVSEIRSNKGINGTDKIAFIPMELVPDSEPFVKYQLRKRDEIHSFTYCQAGDLLLAKITPSLENGKQGIVPLDVPNGVALATTEVFPIHTNTSSIDTLFLYYVLKHAKFRNKIISSMIGTTGRQRASKESVERLEIPLPTTEEQKAIANVLSDVDSALELADQVIEKTERLKRGLMQQLLTHGIGHTETKQTPIGKMPSDWVPTKIGDIAKLQSGGTPRRDVKEYWTNGKIPWLKSGELNDGVVCQAEERISQQGLDDSAAKIFPKGTFLMAMYGKGTVTKTGILGIEAATNQAVCAFIPKDKQFSPKFLQYSLIFKRNQLLGQLTNPSTDMGRTNIYAGILASYQIPLPNKIEEQEKIAEIIQEADAKLRLEQLEKSKLQNIKRGLMDLLLTGKVRIKVD